MPARRKRAGKHARAQKAGPSTREILRLAMAMEVPLNDAIDAAHALRFMGYGLTQLGDAEEGRAITAAAWSACQNLDTLQDTWRRIYTAAGGRKARRRGRRSRDLN